MTEENVNADGTVTIACDFARARSVLLTHGNLRPLFERWPRHHDVNRLNLEPEHAALFENALGRRSSCTLPGQSRSRHVTWTINIGRPAVNLFLGGDTITGAVTGRVFTEGVAAFDNGRFFQESIVAGKGPFRSHAIFRSGRRVRRRRAILRDERTTPGQTLRPWRLRVRHGARPSGLRRGLVCRPRRGHGSARSEKSEDLGHIETRAFPDGVVVARNPVASPACCCRASSRIPTRSSPARNPWRSPALDAPDRTSSHAPP